MRVRFDAMDDESLRQHRGAAECAELYSRKPCTQLDRAKVIAIGEQGIDLSAYDFEKFSCYIRDNL